ncbi:MAG TPA: DUF4623 domain-containing protein [Candidatus Paceibacterota bacterium]|nr:DUF4623 domain-containing protein [Verrucomicrobiota bacterium]HOX02926.1 DUF4623 domain-containing protein [Verrucomicrobiota bacterium]HRZ45678.1 DUF4623 domain-containing protein [Candidatus Paceibacterota bacterium]HRZ93720.1 DUF4623 domain-containing protein [Candidatus Paceibacterota bacterium]
MKTSALLLTVVTLAVAAAYSQAQSLESLWVLKPGDRTYLTTDNIQRGMTYNPATGHVLIANRATSVNVVDGATGADVGTMNITGISGGTFALNMISAGSDGVIYGANLTTDSSTTPFKVYRWANESAVPELVYSGDPSGGNPTATNRRFGDTLDVRGAGNDVHILAASRAGTIVASIKTDGSTFTATPLQTDATAGDLGLGLAFGPGNTFLGTAAGRLLRQIDVDTGLTVAQYGTNVLSSALTIVGVDPGANLLAGITLNTSPLPDTLDLYGLNTLSEAVLNTPLDSEPFPVDNANGNGTGAIDFFGNVVYALDSNNGLMAMTVPEPAILTLFAGGLIALLGRARRRP